jgi:hypothetical protein
LVPVARAGGAAEEPAVPRAGAVAVAGVGAAAAAADDGAARFGAPLARAPAPIGAAASVRALLLALLFAGCFIAAA